MTDNVQTVQLSIIHNLEQAYYDVKKTEYKKKNIQKRTFGKLKHICTLKQVSAFTYLHIAAWYLVSPYFVIFSVIIHYN